MRDAQVYVLGKINDYNIFINQMNILQLEVKGLSGKSSEQQIFTYGTDLEEVGLFDAPFEVDGMRIQEAKDFLEGSVVIFKLEEAAKGYYKTVNLTLRPQKEQILATSYTAIPVFSETLHGSLEDLIEKLQNRKMVGQHAHTSNDAAETPSHILFKKSDGSIYAMGPIQNQRHAHGGKMYELAGDLHVSRLTAVQLADYYLIDDVAFISAEKDQQLVAHLCQQAPVQEADQEAQFMDIFYHQLKSENMHYRKEDLHHFHTAMKAGGLIVLGGMSGTGKSQLVNAYTRTLGLSKDQMRMIPVSPSWLDETDVLGYVDTVQQRYMPAMTGIAKTLVEATHHPEKTYVICLDEMNLAKIEHYFSQFLSVLELEVGDPHRVIQLYSEAFTVNNAHEFPAQVPIGHNIVFVGTVNFDESTHRLSDKVLDRANLIELDVEPFTKLMEKVEVDNVAKPTAYTLQKLQPSVDDMQLSEQELTFLWELSQLMGEAMNTVLFGPRTVKQMNQYMRNAYFDATFTREDALDMQIVSRVLPKLRGPKPLFEACFSQTEKPSKFMQLLENYRHLSHFERTKQKMKQKEKELLHYGYAL